MMRLLYLHIGIHKTGSSFLQYLLAINRIEKNKIYFPKARKRDENMLQGKISAGNGRDLTNFLLKNDLKSSIRFLESAFKEAESRSCFKLLVSDKRLAKALALPHCIENWKTILDQLQIGQIRVLVFLRDPLDHLISLYKHRSKNGDHKNFETWLRTDFDTMRILDKLFFSLEEYPFEWTFRKYQYDSIFLIDSFFKDWLKTPTPTLPKDNKINSSLTLSELKVLQSVKSHMPQAVPFIWQSFNDLPKSQKQIDNSIISYYKNQGGFFLKEYIPLIKKINKFLPEDEQLIFHNTISKSEVESNRKDISVTLSFHQLEAFSLGLEKYAKSNKWLGTIKYRLGILKRKIKSFRFPKFN